MTDASTQAGGNPGGSRWFGWLKSIGPAIIIASVVLGPGSILLSSRVGAEYGYGMLWVLVLAVAMMVGLVALCARLGVIQDGSMCDELSESLGRPVTAIIGLVFFLIVALYQTSNNIAILAATEPIFEHLTGRPAEGSALQGRVVPIVLLLVFNGLILGILYGFRGLYKKIEVLMKVVIGLMVLAFFVNMFIARPDFVAALGGLVPDFPQGGLMPHVVFDGTKNLINDPLWAVQGWVMTTCSVAAAFYQGYLVREKGWTKDNVKEGLTDSFVGIITLGVLSMMIMMTSAAVLYGKVDSQQLRSVSDVANQLEPTFGPVATWLFSLGIFAGAFNPFLINAMIGGTLFSDSLGLGAKIDMKWPKLLTTAALLVGMVAAIFSISTGTSTINIIVFAQALTVLGVPVLALAILFLAMRAKARATGLIPFWMKLFCALTSVLMIVLAFRTAYRLYLQFTMG
jgi:Mn2+/Fe2+ NRAMP family transporter